MTTSNYIINPEKNTRVTNIKELETGKVYRCRLGIAGLSIIEKGEIGPAKLLVTLKVYGMQNMSGLDFEYITEYSDAKVLAYSKLNEILFTKRLKIKEDNVEGITTRYIFE